MTLALKIHGLLTIALVLSLSLGLDLWLAHLMGHAGGAPIVQMWGVGFNGTQIGLCLLASAMSSWKACGLLHVRMAIREKRCGSAAAAAILLACAVTVSAVVELSWLERHLITEVAAKSLQGGANFSTTFASAYFHEGIFIVFLQLATATLPLIVFGDIEGMKVTHIQGARAVPPTSTDALTSTDQLPANLADGVPSTSAPIVQTEKTPVTEEPRCELRPPTSDAVFAFAYASILSAIARRPILARAFRPSAAKTRRPSPASKERAESSLPAAHPDRAGPACMPHMAEQVGAGTLPVRSDGGPAPTPADRVPIPAEPGPTASSQRGGAPGPRPSPVQPLVRPAQWAWIPGSDGGAAPIPAGPVWTPKPEPTAASGQAGGSGPHLSPVQALTRSSKRTRVSVSDVRPPADLLPTPTEAGPAAASQEGGAPASRSAAQAMARPAERAWISSPDVRWVPTHADAVPTPNATGRDTVARQASVGPVHLAPTQAMAQGAQRAQVLVSTMKPTPIPADPVPTLNGAGRIGANRWARGSRLPLSPGQAAADYLDWALEHALYDRIWSVNDVWHMAAEDFASATDIVLPPRNLFLGALKKLPGVRVQYDKRIQVGGTRIKTTVYVFSRR